MLRRYLWVGWLLLLCACIASTKNGQQADAQIPIASGHLRLVSWNVQNLFDSQWQGTEYPEYDPRYDPREAAERGEQTNQTTKAKERASSNTWEETWGETGFRYRIKSLAAVLDRLNADILALMEVESKPALHQLNLQLHQPYRYHLLLPQKRQAINIGLLSRIAIQRSLRHEIGFTANNQKQLRAIIEVHLENGLILLLNHWKSQRGGYYQTLGQRQQAATVLTQRLQQLNGNYVLVLGDFNEPADSFVRYTDSSLAILYGLKHGSCQPQQAQQSSNVNCPVVDSPSLMPPLPLFSPWFAYDAIFDSAIIEPYFQAPILQQPILQEQLASKDKSFKQISQGSYYFRGAWQAIDNIFLVAQFFPEYANTNARKWQFARFTVPRFAPLVLADGQPNAWRKQTLSGISDHLPLLLELRHKTLQ